MARLKRRSVEALARASSAKLSAAHSAPWIKNVTCARSQTQQSSSRKKHIMAACARQSISWRHAPGKAYHGGMRQAKHRAGRSAPLRTQQRSSAAGASLQQQAACQCPIRSMRLGGGWANECKPEGVGAAQAVPERALAAASPASGFRNPRRVAGHSKHMRLRSRLGEASHDVELSVNRVGGLLGSQRRQRARLERRQRACACAHTAGTTPLRTAPASHCSKQLF